MGKDSWYSGAAEVFIENKNFTNAVSQFAKQAWIRVIDFTPEKLKDMWVWPIKQEAAMKVVVNSICEFYWCKMWELQSSKENLQEKYAIKQNHFDILVRYWNVGIAYNQFKRQFTWDPKVNSEWEMLLSNIEDVEVPTQQKHLDIPSEKVKVIEKQMLTTEITQLKNLIKNETDEKKLKLYDLQLQALSYKQEEDV